MALRDRLRRLEGGMPTPRCADCAGWAPSRVVYVNDAEHGPREPQPPERCPRCGYEPIEIHVEYCASWPPNAAGGQAAR